MSPEKALVQVALALSLFVSLLIQGDDVENRHHFAFHLMLIRSQQTAITLLFALDKI